MQTSTILSRNESRKLLTKKLQSKLKFFYISSSLKEWEGINSLDNNPLDWILLKALSLMTKSNSPINSYNVGLKSSFSSLNFQYLEAWLKLLATPFKSKKSKSFLYLSIKALNK
mgnify:CR=1 FL=1